MENKETIDRTPGAQARPIVKWAGGKRQLFEEIQASMPESYGRYFEPMIGGGAVFFGLQPQGAYLSDINSELINLYLVVRDQVEELIVDLSSRPYNEDYYYQLRAADREESYRNLGRVARASRFIYLNRTCFNGLYRVNSKGQFNVPFGRYKNPKIIDVDNLRASSLALSSSQIELASYQGIEKLLTPGDFVYFDPPYAPLTATSSFTSYTAEGFEEDAQVELRDFCKKLDSLGVKFILSNSSAPLILELYRDFDLRLVEAARAINSKGDKRGKVKEVLVKNY